MRTAPDPATGELVAPSRRGAAAWLTYALSGARIGLTRAAGGARLLWCETRLSALCSADVNDHTLAAPPRLLDGAAAATKLAHRLGLPPREGAPALVRRLDLASDVDFVRAADGVAFLSAMAHLDVPRYKRVPTHAKGSSELEGVEWRTPSAYKIVQRTYDKGRQAGIRAPGHLVRIERQWWVPSAERAPASVFAAMELAAQFVGPLKAWVDTGAEVVAVGPYDACALLRSRVGHKLGSKNGNGRVLTLRVVERMAGTIGVLGVYGDGWYGNPRTAARRRAELRRVGIEFVSDVPAGRRVDVGSVLHAACGVWRAGAVTHMQPHARGLDSESAYGHAWRWSRRRPPKVAFMGDTPDSLNDFDAWLWGLAAADLDALSVAALAQAGAASRVELPQLTVLTVIGEEEVDAFECLVRAGAGTVLGQRRARCGGLIWSRLGASDFVVSVWRSAVRGVYHLIGSVPVTDSRWRRVEESWLRAAAPRLAPVILNKVDFESVGDALSEYGTVEVSRLTARVLSDHSSYYRGWHSDVVRRKPTHREALRETEGMLVRTLTLRVGERLSLHLRRHAGATYYHGDYRLFVDVVLRRFTRAAAERRVLLSNRSREHQVPLTEGLVMLLPPQTLADELGRRDLIDSVGSLRGVQVAVFHRNPYLHFTVTDYLDGSNLDVFVTEDDRVTVLPGYRASLGSLARLTDAIGDALGMVSLGAEPVAAQIPDVEFIG